MKRVLMVLLVVLLSSCVVENGVSITEEDLSTLLIDQFVVEEESIKVKQNDTELEINNLVERGESEDGTVYFYLSTDDEKKQLLVVLNNELKKVQWGAYYPENSYFDPVELVAIVVEPFEKRHQKVIINLSDFKLEYFSTNEYDFSISTGSIRGGKNFYYLAPEFSKVSWGGYLVTWYQGYFSFFTHFYGLYEEHAGRRGAEMLFSTGESGMPIDELIALPSAEKNEVVDGYTIVAENENEDYTVKFIVPEDEEISWKNCEIGYTDKNTGEEKKELFANIFEYQDTLKSITAAQNKDERISFIVDTKEFSYDFYFDPSGETTDTFLRPSSFVRLYPK